MFGIGGGGGRELITVSTRVAEINSHGEKYDMYQLSRSWGKLFALFFCLKFRALAFSLLDFSHSFFALLNFSRSLFALLDISNRTGKAD